MYDMLLALLFFFVVLSPLMIHAGLNVAERIALRREALNPGSRPAKRKTHAARGPRIHRRGRSAPQRHLLGNNLREVRLLEAVDLLVKFVDLAGPVH